MIAMLAVMLLTGCSEKSAENTPDGPDVTASGTTSDHTTSITSFLNSLLGGEGETETAPADSYDFGDPTYGFTDSEAKLSFKESSLAKTPGYYDSTASDFDASYDDGWFSGEGSAFLADEYYVDGTLPADGDIIWEEEPPTYIRPAAGLLTAGEWNDNLHFDFLKNLLANGQQQDYSSFFKNWDLTPFSRLAVHVSTGDIIHTVSGAAIGATNVNNATVTVYSSDDRIIWQSKTDNKGMTYAFYRLTGGDAVPAKVKAVSGDFSAEKEVESADLLDDSIFELVLDDSANAAKQLDLMSYLQKELEDVISRVKHDNDNLRIRLSINFYRDDGDVYVVRSNEFTTDIDSQLILLNAEYADGGGDYEEAVEMALEDGVNNHSWNEDSTKLMFMVLDAPPHNTSDIRRSLASSITDAISKGIRIIPVASSGIDKSTEFLLRTFAMTTGGTYTFLTDHSGIGDSHIEPTVGDYEVENLNDLLVRVITEFMS